MSHSAAPPIPKQRQGSCDVQWPHTLWDGICLTARNTASARLSSKRARTRIELAFRAKSILVGKEQKMNKMVLFLLLAFSSALALSSANSQVGKVTRLMTKDLPDVPGKEGMIETVDFAPGEVSQPHRHNADLFVYVLEGSVITQVKGGISQTVRAGEVFYESPTDVHIVSRNASETQPAKLLVFYVKAKGTPPTVLLGEGER